ncbi:MAG: hypothetical protein WA982_09610, partial [Rubrobacteraceae bacterium]
MREPYNDRKLSEGYPGLEGRAFAEYMAIVEEHESKQPDSGFSVEKLLNRVDRLVDLSEIRNVLVLGCGPKPQSVEFLLREGYEATGVEPVRLFASSAQEYLGSTEKIIEGSAEEIPLP